MKYRDFVKILEAHGFAYKRSKGDHHHYEGWIKGRRRLVTCSYARANDDILPKTLASMIRQSGLPKKLFG